MAYTELDPDVYGWIDEGGGSMVAHDQSGTTNACNVRDTTGPNDEYRTYYSFNTSTIPDNATIEDAVLACYLYNCQEDMGCSVSEYALDFYYEHNRIGAAITTDDWALTTFAANKSWGGTLPSLPHSWDQDVPNAGVNVDGDSDFEVRDDSVWTGSTNGPTYNLPARGSKPARKVWLEVTYTVPGGWFNRFNWRLPALPGFSHVIAAVLLPSGLVQITQRFYPRQVALEA